MVRSGDVLEHPVTRERIVIRKTARDTGGELFQGDLYLQAGAFVAAEHIRDHRRDAAWPCSGQRVRQRPGRERRGSQGRAACVVERR